MRGYPDDIVAAVSKTEMRVLRRVYEAVRVEFEIPQQGDEAQDVANFLMSEFRQHPFDESTFLGAARAFCLTKEINRNGTAARVRQTRWPRALL